MRILFSVLLSTLFIASAMAQHADPQTPVRYGFVKGRSSVYQNIYRHFEETDNPDSEGNGFTQTQQISICVKSMDSAGTTDLVITVDRDEFGTIDGLESSPPPGIVRGHMEPKIGTRITAYGDYIAGSILEASQLRKQLRERASNPGSNIMMRSDTSFAKIQCRAIFPLLPSSDRIVSSVEREGLFAGRSIIWLDENGNRITSDLRDSLVSGTKRYVILESGHPPTITEESSETQIVCTRELRTRSIFRATDGVLVARTSLTRTRYTRSENPEKTILLTQDEEVRTLVEEKPCAQ